MVEQDFKDVDDMAKHGEEDDSKLYHKRKSAAEMQLEEELKKDSKETEEKSKQKVVKKPAKQTKSASNTQPSSPQKKKPKKKKAKPKESPKTIIIKEESSGNWATIAISAIVIVAIVLVLYAIFIGFSPEEGTTDSVTDTTVAVINGIPIYSSEVTFRQNLLASMGNPFVTEEIARDQLIEEKLLLKEAEEKKYSITKNEAEEKLGESLTQRGLTFEDMKTQLSESDVDYENMLKFYQTQLIISEFLEGEWFTEIEVSDATAKAYYDENLDLFDQPPGVQVRHILVMYGTMSENETYEKAQTIEAQIQEDGKNFCDLVEEYTEDVASKDTCGEYNFTELDPLVEEFKIAGFDMAPKETRIVKTQFGYHIMYKVKDLGEGKIPFNLVADQIKEVLSREQTQEIYDKNVAALKDGSIIELYNTKAEPEVTEPIEPVTPIKPAENEQNTDSQIADDSAEDTDVMTPIEPAEPISPVETTVIIKPTKPSIETLPTGEARLKGLAECLTENEAILYTVYWSPDVEIQLAYFEEYANELNVVECDPQGDNYKGTCNFNDHNAYPSWLIDGKEYPGVQSLIKIAAISGCPY